jgi:hypothetical protein
MHEIFRINPKSGNISLKIIKERIDKGFKLQALEESILTDDDRLELSDAIIIAPDYQREYSSSVADESSLIESVLLGIPIPPIFLASQKLKGVPVLNVVDGQHRLRAFYRFINNDFKLKGLEMIDKYNTDSFKTLSLEDRQFLLNTDVINTITFSDFPGEKFELEIFSRYNKGTKPLSPQDIRHAVYSSKVNDLVNMFCKGLVDNDLDERLINSYGSSSERYKKKKTQESIFVILSILESGIIQEAKKSPAFAESYMKSKHELEKKEIESVVFEELDKTKVLFNNFNKMIMRLADYVECPFSKEIYGVSNRGGKFQVSISMILASIFHDINRSDKLDIDFIINNKMDEFHELIKVSIFNSYLEDPEYKASTTNTDEIKKLTDSILSKILEI